MGRALHEIYDMDSSCHKQSDYVITEMDKEIYQSLGINDVENLEESKKIYPSPRQ